MVEPARPKPAVAKPERRADDADRALELKVEKMAREQARVGQTVRGAKS